VQPAPSVPVLCQMNPEQNLRRVSIRPILILSSHLYIVAAPFQVFESKCMHLQHAYYMPRRSNYYTDNNIILKSAVLPAHLAFYVFNFRNSYNRCAITHTLQQKLLRSHLKVTSLKPAEVPAGRDSPNVAYNELCIFYVYRIKCADDMETTCDHKRASNP
jgi:hypothetical protein